MNVISIDDTAYRLTDSGMNAVPVWGLTITSCGRSCTGAPQRTDPLSARRRKGHRVFTSLVFAMFDWKLPKLQKQIDDESRARLKYLKKRLDEA
jgi:hypothetical protein